MRITILNSTYATDDMDIIEDRFLERAHEQYPYLQHSDNPYHCMLFLLLIVGKLREEIAKDLDMNMYNIHALQIELNFNYYIKYDNILRVVKQKGYKSWFEAFNSNEESVAELRREFDIKPRSMSILFRKIVKTIRCFWFGYSEEKEEQIWKGVIRNADSGD